MSLQIAILFALLGGMVYLFLTEKIPVDLTAFVGLSILIFAGFVKPSEAFEGFSSPAVITMLSVFILGAALLETGIADIVGSKIHRIVGDGEIRLIVVLMIVAGVLSAFMNNIAATAVLMPAVGTLGRRARIAPSRLFMPLAFGAILGGTTTLVGTPPNLLGAQMLADRGLEPFQLFDFTPMGLAVLAVGLIYMVTIGRKLLPSREERGPTERAVDLRNVYQLDERVFSIRLPATSPLAGKTLAETRMGNTLGVKVVSLFRGDRRIGPEGSTRLEGGDLLLVHGDAAHVDRLLSMGGVEVESVTAMQLPPILPGVQAVRAAVDEESPLAGRTLRELGLRARYGVGILAIRRGEHHLRENLAREALQVGDEILGIGPQPAIERFASEQKVEVEEVGLGELAELQERLKVVLIPAGSSLVDSTLAGSRLGELAGVTVIGVVRDGQTRLAVTPDEVIEAGDRLVLTGDAEKLAAIADLARSVDLVEESSETALETEKLGMVEVAVAPRSDAVGRTLTELDFRKRFGLIALALWRGGEPIHTDLGNVRLMLGDALLLHGPRNRIEDLAGESNFVVLSQTVQKPRRTAKAPWALLGLALMIGLVATGTQPIAVASFAAASLVILAGALTMKEAYRVIEWRAVFLVAAVLPVGAAMERTGAAQFLADSVTSLAGPSGPYVVLFALIALASLLSQGLDGAPAVVLLAPVVIQMADQLELSPYPLMMGVSLAASAAFMTPFSHKANLLVMGAGGYRSSDYVKVGTPLTILILVLLTVLVPVFFPF